MFHPLALFFALTLQPAGGQTPSWFGAPLAEPEAATAVSPRQSTAAPPLPVSELRSISGDPARANAPRTELNLEGAVVGRFALPTILPQVKAGRLDADAIVGKIQAFYKSTERLTAKFRQTTITKAFGRKQVSNGKLYVSKPGKMRWDYKKARKGQRVVTTKSFISDGENLWAINHVDKQYAEKSLKDDLLPVAITFLTGHGDLRRDFSSALDASGRHGKSSDYVLKLTPRQPSAQYKSLWLVVDPANFRVKHSIVLNAAGDENRISFYEPDTKRAVRDTWFSFNAKKHKEYRLFSPKQLAPK